MADIQKTIEVIFSAVDQTGQTFSGIGSNVSKFATGLESATQPLADLATKIELAETAVLGLGAAFGANAISSFSKFQTASIDLAKVLDDTDPSIKEFEQSAKDLSLQYGISSEEILQSISNFKQAGFTAKEASTLQKNALDLVIAGDISAAQASDFLVRSLKGFNLAADESGKFVESLNAVSNKYATDVQQLAEGMARISPVAKTMGFSFQEAEGLLTPIIEVFGSGSEAADALKTGLVKLVDDAKPVREALESIGVSQKDANGQLRSGKDIFYDVAAAFQTMDDKQKLFLTSQLVGLDQAPKMVKVFDNLAEVQQITATAMENAGTVAGEVQKRLNSLAVAANINEQAWHNMSIAVGEQLSGGALDSTKSMTALGLALEQAVNKGQFAPIIDGINAAEKGFAQFVANIAKNLPEALSHVDFGPLVRAFGNLGGQFADIFSGVDLSTADGLAKTIQFLVDSLASLTEVSAGVVNGLTPLGKTMFATLEAFNKSPESVKQFAGTIIGTGQAINTLAGFVTGFGGAIEGIGKSLEVVGSINLASNLLAFVNKLEAIPGPLGTVIGLLGKAGLLGAALETGYVMGGVLNDGITAVVSSLTGSNNSLGTWIYDLTHSGEAAVKTGEQLRFLDKDLQDVNKTTGLNITSQKELDSAINNGLIVYDELTQKWNATGKAAQTLGESTKVVKDSQAEWNAAVTKTNEMLGLNRDYIGRVVSQYSTLAEAEHAAAEANSDVIQSNITYEDGVYNLWQKEKSLTESHDAVAESSRKVAEQTDKLTDRQKIAIENTHELEMKLIELASNERIKSMEFVAEIKVAEVQADAQRVVAAFDEIGKAIEATQAASAQIFASLVDSFNNKNISFLNREFLKDYAMRQQEQAQEALDDQARLIDAQVAWMNAKTQALLSGQALININADNLDVELRLVLKSLLEAIQIEANAEGLEMLL